MEEVFDEIPTCFSLGDNGRIALGFVDGSIRMKTMDVEQKKLESGWQFNMKGSVRDLVFNHEGSELYCISRNKAVCSYDVETGKRTRCIVEGTKGRPNTLCLLPPTARKHQQFATGDETGEVRTWDFRAQNPQISKWKEQEDDVNALAMDTRHNLLSASSDGTLAAYEVRKCKMRMKSETMHSELLCLAVTDKYVYVGGGDGHLEVFTHGEYGNLLERIETGFEMGVNGVVELRKGLLMTSSETSSKLRLLNVLPTKRLGAVGSHGESDEGIDRIAVSPDRSILVSMAGMANSIKLWPLAELLEDIPLLRANDIKKRKQIVKEGFFDDLVDAKKKRQAADSDDSDDEVTDEEAGSEEEGAESDGEEEDSEDEEEDSDDEE